MRRKIRFFVLLSGILLTLYGFGKLAANRGLYLKALRHEAKWNTGPLHEDGTNDASAVYELKASIWGYKASVSGTGNFEWSPNGWGAELISMSSGWNVRIVSAEIEEGITSICDMAFSGCSSLKKVCLPKSLEEIGVKAFAYCRHLSSIQYEGSRKEWEALDAASPDWNEESRIKTVVCTDGVIQIDSK